MLSTPVFPSVESAVNLPLDARERFMGSGLAESVLKR